MPDENAPETTSPEPSRRFRFGLKTLFVVMTLLCVWLGYKFACERRADAIIARHQAVLEGLITQIATPPQDAFYVIGVDSEDQLLQKLSFPGKEFRRRTILDVGHSASSTTENLIVDVSKLLATMKPNDIVNQLSNHYGANLAAIGMQRTVSGSGSSSEGEMSMIRSVWNSKNNDLVVIIDAEVHPKAQRAFVSVMLIDAQQLHLW